MVPIHPHDEDVLFFFVAFVGGIFGLAFLCCLFDTSMTEMCFFMKRGVHY
jgi:hypothetical protein